MCMKIASTGDVTTKSLQQKEEDSIKNKFP
jgi:hypothetical protein